MTLPAVMRAAGEISLKRVAREEGKDAEDFLDMLNPERILQMGMMADAAAEALTLIRIFDDEVAWRPGE